MRAREAPWLKDDNNCREWKLKTVDPQERSTWRSGARSAMCAASQLPGRGSTDVNDAIQKSDNDDAMSNDKPVHYQLQTTKVLISLHFYLFCSA